MQKRSKQTEKKKEIDDRTIRYPATCRTFVGKCRALGYHVDIHPFSLVGQIFAGHTYFSLVTASSGQIYWSTEILYVNSAFS